MKIDRCATVIALLCSFAPQVRGAAQPRPVRFVSWGGIGGAARAQAAARIGIDTHRLPIGWPDATGRYDFEDFDRKLRWLHEAGINVVVHFFNHFVPDWFWKRHPDARLCNAQGRRTGKFGPSLWHPAVLEAIRRNETAILEHLRKAGLLKWVDGVDVGVGHEGQLTYDWTGYWAFDPHALAAYRWFLVGRYRGDVERLNREWGTQHRSFVELRPPTRYTRSRECEVFEEFYREGLLQGAIALSEPVAARVKPRIWFWMSHFVRERERHYAARYPLYYMRRLKKLGRATVVQVSVVPGWQTKEDIAGLKALGLRVIGEIHITPTAEQQRQHARLAWNLGCDGFFVGTLENLFHEDGTPTAAGRETARIIRNWRRGTAP